MTRTVSWFSCGAASAIATKLSNPDVIAYCDTGSEDYDNRRFMNDCREWFQYGITILKNDKYRDTWDVWEKKRFLSGINGAPCTGELKVAPRLLFQRPYDVHVFGYTADSNDIRRFESFKEHYPDLAVIAPLIEKGITKAACIAMLRTMGVKEPRVYAMGFQNANCIPCVKATSPDYWALVRLHFPYEFNRMVALSRSLGVRLTRIKGERIFIDEIPADHPTTKPIAPECDFLCSMVEQEMMEAIE
jgi:hypothetical protein